MTLNSLFPAYVQIAYHSDRGEHVMTLPTREHISEASTGGSGTFNSWGDVHVDADAMINDLVTLFLPFFKPTATFDYYTIYTMASEDAVPLAVASKALGLDGTSTQTAWHLAVQTTFSFRTTEFGISKLVFLDAPSGGVFGKVLGFDGSPEAVAIRDQLADTGAAWAGRDNGRPDTMLQISYTLNEKLRREYNLN